MIKLIFSLIVLIIPASVFAEDKAVFALDVIRHGDRMPVSDIPNSTYKWPVPFGQLTPKGIHQEYELGVQMRNEYMYQYALLPMAYQPGTLYVRSSDVDRTLMSAEAVLTGLYPHGTGPYTDLMPALPDRAQPIPIHTVSGKEETLLYPDGPRYKFDELCNKYVTPAKEWQEKTKKISKNFQRWSKATGVNIKSLYDLKGLADTMFIRKLYKVPLPEGLTERDADEIISAGRWAFMANFSPEIIGQTTGSPLLKEIINYVNEAASGKTQLKHVLFSAHDSTIMAELSAMGAPLRDNPPQYSSRLNFMLFDTDNGYAVRIKYNGNPVAVKGCEKDFCTLKQFSALVK